MGAKHSRSRGCRQGRSLPALVFGRQTRPLPQQEALGLVLAQARSHGKCVTRILLPPQLLQQLGRFLEHHRVRLYSEHLSYCSDDGQLYDLLPIPFTDEAVRHTAARIARVQDLLGRRIAVENVSYYLAPQPAMDELAFTNAVLAEADCDLLLDVNNVYVNACNHGYDADAFIAGLPAQRIVCLHVAGHLDEAPDLKIDTHGSPVIDPVWALLGRTYARIRPRPTPLERDFHFPPHAELQGEPRTIRHLLATPREAAHA